MTRTQIHLGKDEVALLDAESSRTGASRSELIRRAIVAAYGEPRAHDEPKRRPPLTSFGVAPGLAIDPDEIDAELARIYEERARHWHR